VWAKPATKYQRTTSNIAAMRKVALTNDYCCLLASDLLLLAVNCKFLVSAEPQIKLHATKVLAKYASGLS
jgi:hypothetical protein